MEIQWLQMRRGLGAWMDDEDADDGRSQGQPRALASAMAARTPRTRALSSPTTTFHRRPDPESRHAARDAGDRRPTRLDRERSGAPRLHIKRRGEKAAVPEQGRRDSVEREEEGLEDGEDWQCAGFREEDWPWLFRLSTPRPTIAASHPSFPALHSHTRTQ